MAQWNKNTQDFLNQERTLFEVPMIATKDGSPVSVDNPFPVSLGSSNITINGNVSIGATVNVASSPENPVHNHITEVGTSDILNVPYLPVGVGTVNLDLTHLPIGITSISNEVSIGNTGTIPVSIIKNGLPISDTVALPTRVLNDEALIAYARGAAVTENDVLSAFLVDKSGATTSLGIAATSMSTVWGGAGLFPWNTFTGSGDKLYIQSVTNDPKIQGKSITIEGLNSSYNRITETVSFNAVDTTIAGITTNNFYRINKIYLTGNNTNSLPHDYDINVSYGSTTGTIVSKLVVPWGRGQNLFYTIPAGYEGFILAMNGNSGKEDEITSSLWVRTFNGTWELIKSFKFISGLYDHNFRTPLRIPEKSDIEMRAFALVESSSIGCEFQMLVIPKVV